MNDSRQFQSHAPKGAGLLILACFNTIHCGDRARHSHQELARLTGLPAGTLTLQLGRLIRQQTPDRRYQLGRQVLGDNEVVASLRHSRTAPKLCSSRSYDRGASSESV